MKTEENIEWIDVEANHDIDEFKQLLDSEKTKENSSDFKIEEELKIKWTGVKSCGDPNRMNNEVKVALENWVRNKMFEHRNLRFKYFGHNGYTYYVRSAGGNMGSARTCAGWATIQAYIVFEQ